MRAEPRSATGRGRPSWVAACLIASLTALVAIAPNVGAHGSAQPFGAAAGEERLRSYEAATLGESHALEHARARMLDRAARRRWMRLTPRQRRRIEERERAQQRALEHAAGPASQVGAWTTAPFRIPTFGMHATLLPTGKVLLFSSPSKSEGYPLPNRAVATIWDPALGRGPSAFRDVAPPPADDDGDGNASPAPIYCSGHAFLPNGALVVAGGNLVWPSLEGDDYTYFAGVRHVFTFDPWRETWQVQPQMGQGRWYPTLLEMANGKTLILGGYNEQAPGGTRNLDLEVFAGTRKRSGVGQISRQAAGDRSVAPYPHLFTLPNRDVLLAGPESADSAVLDSQTFSWREIPTASRTRVGGNAVLLPTAAGRSSAVAQIGGYDSDGVVDADGVKPATETTEIVSIADPGEGWRPGPSLNLARSYQNTVLLPDGSMVAVGGGIGFGPKNGAFDTDPDGSLRQVEIYDPRSKGWRLGPPQREDRAYHSTAVLLPSGRVLSSGDDYNPSANGTYSSFDTAEIYSPPYLFRGRRPRIRSAPRSIRWGDAFGIRSRGRVARAVLMAPGSTTHGADMSQRHIGLRVLKRFGRRGANLRAPAGAGIAPPGYYMLFLLNRKGVPSRARWLRVSASAPGRPLLGAGRAPRRSGR